MTEIGDWLANLGLGQYATIFAENAIDREILPELSDEDLARLGLPLGHRKKILRAIAELAKPAKPAAAAAPRGPAAGEAERRHLTVMFCDLVGYTRLSQQLDPEDLRQVIHAYQDCCAGIVTRLEGFLARYLGDGVLVYFGFPRAHEDDAERAVQAGLQIIAAVQRLRPHGELTLQARVGIASGLVIVGDLTSVGAIQEYAVVGETPNIAARLQALAEPDSLVIERATHKMIEGLFDCVDLGPHALKGMAEPVQVWRVVGERSADDRFQARRGARLGPLVGREREVALLQDRWGRARGGEGQVVLVSGDPGIGKSRLVQAFLQPIGQNGSAKLRYYGSPHHESSALYPFLQQLSQAAGLTRADDDESRLAKLQGLLRGCVADDAASARLVADMLSLRAGQSAAAPVVPQGMTERSLQVILGQITALCRDRPVLMVVEDAHWMDPSSLDLLASIVDRANALRLLVLVTFRSGFVPPLLPQPWVSRIELGRLQAQQCEAIVQHLAQAKAVPAELLAEIVERTDGVPLFVEEVTKAVLETGVLVERGERYELAGKMPTLAIPTTLHGALLARLDRFSGAREVAQIGAAIGREFSYGMLRALSPLPEPELQDTLDHLVGSEILLHQGNGHLTGYRFKHALVQDTAYETLLRSRRQQLHGRIARLLEQRFPETAEAEPELLAHHYERADEPAMAAEYRLRAGNMAIARSAMAEAISQIRLGLELLPKLPESAGPARLEMRLQIALGTALRAAKGTGAPETGAAWEWAAALCDPDADPAFLQQALYGRFLFHHVNVHLELARQIGGELIELGRRHDDRGAARRGHGAVGCIAFAQGDLIDARAHLEQAVALARSPGGAQNGGGEGTDSPAVDLAYLSWTLFLLGYPARALAVSADSVASAGSLGRAYDRVLAIGNACYLHQFRGDVAEVRRCADKVVALATEKGFPAWLALGRIFQGWALAKQEPQGPGIGILQDGLANHRAAGDELEVPYFIGLLADVLGDAGRGDEGLSALQEAFSLMAATGERWVEPELYRLRAKLRLVAGAERTAAAKQDLLQALTVARAQHARLPELRAACDLARLSYAQGEPAAAVALLEPLVAWFGADAADCRTLEAARALLGDAGGEVSAIRD